MTELFGQVEILLKLRQRSDLHDYLLTTECDDGIGVIALNNYLKLWLDTHPNEEYLDVSKFISSDLSAIMFGICPVIFLGTNDWAQKLYLSKNELNGYFDKWKQHLCRFLDKLEVPARLVIVPEKDVVIRLLSGDDGGLEVLNGAVEDMLHVFRGNSTGSTFLDKEYSAPEKDIRDYSYYDSHLLSRDYIDIYTDVMRGFGLSGYIEEESITLSREDYVGDLASKLNADRQVSKYLQIDYIGSGVIQTGGDGSFASPLRDTFQSFNNDKAPVDAKVVIFGDSHSSIYDQRKMTYLFANTFSRCDFYWDPLRIHRPDVEIDADYVVLEISQRFLY